MVNGIELIIIGIILVLLSLVGKKGYNKLKLRIIDRKIGKQSNKVNELINIIDLKKRNLNVSQGALKNQLKEQGLGSERDDMPRITSDTIRANTITIEKKIKYLGSILVYEDNELKLLKQKKLLITNPPTRPKKSLNLNPNFFSTFTPSDLARILCAFAGIITAFAGLITALKIK